LENKRKAAMEMSPAAAAKCRLGRFWTQMLRRGYSPAKQAVVSGSGSMYSAAQILRDRRRKKPLVLMVSETEGWRFLRTLQENDLPYIPCFLQSAHLAPAEIGELACRYEQEGCDCIVALGGGAVMNTAKALAVLLVRPGEPEGTAFYRRVRLRKAPMILTLPTAAGSGAEAAAWAEFFDETGCCHVIASRALTPAVTVLDPGLLENTPRPEVAEAGLEGLCLAIESYLAPGNGDREALSMAAEAVRDFVENLELCWNDGGTPSRRNALLEASRKAGIAASSLGYGYVRILCREASRLGVPPADAYGVLLPLVLEKYGNYAEEKLARLAAYSGIKKGGSQRERAKALTDRIRAMAFRMGLSDCLEGIRIEELDAVAAFAATDTGCLPPVFWSENKIRKILETACVSSDVT